MFNNNSTIAPPPDSALNSNKQLESRAAKFFNVQEFVKFLSLFNCKISSLRGRESNCSSATSYSCKRGVGKNLDRGTECAMTSVGKVNENNLQQNQPSCFCRSALLCRQGKISCGSLRQFALHEAKLKRFEPLSRISNAHYHSQRTAPSPRWGEGIDSVITDNLIDTNHLPLTTHHSLIPETVFSRFTSHFSLKRTAFTLAEVLITLGIIGVVAALVIPNFVESYEKQKTAIAVKKAYVELNQVLNMAMNDYGEPSTWNYQKSDELVPWVKTYIEPYVKVLKSGTCPGGNQQCLGMNPLQALGYDPKSNSANASVPTYMIVKTGPDIAWGFWRYQNWLWYEHNTRIRVWVRNPQKIQFWKYKYAYIGKDVFTFVLDVNDPKPHIAPYNPINYSGITNTRKVTRDDLLGTGWGGCNKKASGGGYWGPGDACSALILLDNWKISDDYPWRRN